jgi:hypothetical protein
VSSTTFLARIYSGPGLRGGEQTVYNYFPAKEQLVTDREQRHPRHRAGDVAR